MSGLKKILKEEYEKKNNQISTENLVEIMIRMIEQALNETATIKENTRDLVPRIADFEVEVALAAERRQFYGLSKNQKREFAMTAFIDWLKSPSGGNRANAELKDGDIYKIKNPPFIYITNIGDSFSRNSIVQKLLPAHARSRRRAPPPSYSIFYFKLQEQDLIKYGTDETKNIGGFLDVSIDSTFPADKTETFKIKFKEGHVAAGEQEYTYSAELFEGNLIIALNNSGSLDSGVELSPDTPPPPPPNHVESQDWQNIANQVIQSVISRRSGELTGKQNYYKTPSGTITRLYADFGSTSTTSKADISSGDKQLNISVKKKVSQYLTAQTDESMALLFVALRELPKPTGFEVTKEDNNNDIIITTTLTGSQMLQLNTEIQHYRNTLMTDIRENLDALTTAPPSDRREAGDAALKSLGIYIANSKKAWADYITNSQGALASRGVKRTDLKGMMLGGLLEFKKALLYEAMSGANRFSPDSQQIANRLLIWDEDGAGEYHDLKTWCNNDDNYENIKFDFRYRGSGRPSGWRIVHARPTTDKIFIDHFEEMLNEWGIIEENYLESVSDAPVRRPRIVERGSVDDLNPDRYTFDPAVEAKSLVDKLQKAIRLDLVIPEGSFEIGFSGISIFEDTEET